MQLRRVVCAALAIGALGCEQSKPGRIGIITAVTGSQQAFGQAHERGFEMALEEINAAGGVLGKPLEIVKYDDQSKPDIAAQGVAKLVDQDKVSALIGSYSSESTKSIVPLVARRGVPLLMPTATADNVLDATEGWSFRLCSGATDYANAMVAFFKEAGMPKSVAIVYENTNFGQANGASMKKAATAAGIPIVSDESYTSSHPATPRCSEGEGEEPRRHLLRQLPARPPA
jgi:branched-chain amino acid transport system substrate-binding protein